MRKITVLQTGLHLLKNIRIPNRPISFPSLLFFLSDEISWRWFSTVVTSNFSHGHQLFQWMGIFLSCWKSFSSLQIFFTSSVNSLTISMQVFAILSVLYVVLAYLHLSMDICMLAPKRVIIFCIFLTHCNEMCMNINLVYRISFASIQYVSRYVQSSEIILEKYSTLN
jgi:hypothetical protein